MTAAMPARTPYSLEDAIAGMIVAACVSVVLVAVLWPPSGPAGGAR